MEGTPEGTAASEDITPDELRLAARNHALPLEALRYPITPAGLHYLLIHYDIPAVDPHAFTLEIGGAVERPRTLSLGELQGRERVTMPITFECAGNGRALLEPRPLSQPWLSEAVGTAEWGGTPLAPLLSEAGVSPRALEVVFTGLDRGVEGGEEQLYERALPLGEAERGLLAYEMNGGPLPPQHGFPLRRGRRGRGAGHAHAAALADRPTGRARLLDPRAPLGARSGHAGGPRVVRPRRDRDGRGLDRRRRPVRPGRAR